ncbi:metallophosphoesterase [Corynebacterium hindlerae]|uniref:metallophosphoesterase n=1 Tax=Corynebacterium hindlerae TaxID=699041 RepID=UPI003AAFACA5
MSFSIRTGSMACVKKILLSLFGAGLTTMAWGYSELSRFRLKHETLEVFEPGFLDGGEFTILHISDLHMLPSHSRKQQWVAALSALNPDLVVNTGDNLSSADAVPAVLRALGPLLSKPGLFVFGTNDYFGPRPVNPVGYLLGKKRKVSDQALPWEGMRAAFLEHGWRDATHQRHEFKVGKVRIAAAGVDDPHHHLDNYSLVAGSPNPDADLTIALTHSPEPRVLTQFEADGYDLSLSGHTHGGQLCLPFERAIVTNCGIDRTRANGLHRFGKMWMHVTNGLGTSPYVPFRIFCRPSATLIHLVEKAN